ncbi:GNAT family N-acetyltransferase [Algihabitans albus]|uniref:GNAT family N-acetyltransferase n=1 Tax=Algihabitans albus TaxID=2164067 RepID=UPI000E5CD73A|nr:GNAT family protein [Algihabitans albus]
MPDTRINTLGQPIGWSVPDWTPPARPARKPLEGTRVRLEPLAESHAADLFAANAADRQGQLWTYLAYGPFETQDSYRAWVRKMAESDDPQFFAILDRSSGMALGVASYLRIDPANGCIEVGHICFSPSLAGGVLATEAMAVMMRYAFALGYRRYEWKCDALNAPSRRAARRLGLGFEGVFKSATLYKGRNRDTAWYAITDRLWPRLDSLFERWLDPANFDADGRQQVSLSDLTRPVYEAGCTVTEAGW